MSEVVQVQVGQAGNRIGAEFYRRICAEHGVDSEGKLAEGPADRTYGVHKYFQETSKQTYQPRCVLVDLEPSALDQIRGSAEGRLYSPDQYVFDQVGSGNLFPRGRYGVGAELGEVAMEAVRKQTEACDQLHGVQITHSIGGGTGSGLGSLLISKIRGEYLNEMLCSYTIVPSSTVSDSITEVYNAVLAFQYLVDNTNMTMLFDNEALYGLVQRNLEIERPTYGEINHHIATAMSGITCPIRFPGLLNSNYRKMAVNLVPFPRLHFLTVSEAPLSARHRPASPLTVPQVVESVFDPCNYMTAGLQPCHRLLAGYASFRGNVSSSEVDESLSTLFQSLSVSEWVYNSPCSSLCAVPALDRPVSASLLLNHGLVYALYVRLGMAFTVLLRRKAFLYHYTAEGMDEMEFTEAESNLNDLNSEYSLGTFRPWGASVGDSDED